MSKRVYATDFLLFFKKNFKPSSTRDFTLLISFLEDCTISTALLNNKNDSHLCVELHTVESMTTVQLGVKALCCCFTLQLYVCYVVSPLLLFCVQVGI